MADHLQYVESMKLSVSKHFGEASVGELERLVLMHVSSGAAADHHGAAPTRSFVEVLPQGALFLLAGLVQPSSTGGLMLQAASPDVDSELLRANASATVSALTHLPRWNSETAVAFGQRLLQTEDAEFKLLASPGGGDHAALRFLAGVVQKNMSASEVACALREEAEGRRCMETFRTSPTFGAVVLFACWSVFDDIADWIDEAVDWLKGAAQWVVDAAEHFGEWACKMGKAVVDAAFAKFQDAAGILQQIPILGLTVVAMYAIQGKKDEAVAAFAINANATVTLVAAGVGFWLGGPAGSMAGGALGKAVGLLIQEAIAQAIKDPKLKAEVGDISAVRFITEVALAGAVYGGAAGVGEVLATAAGLSFMKAVATSVSLAALLSRIPEYFLHKALDDDKPKKSTADAGSSRGPEPVDDLSGDDYGRISCHPHRGPHPHHRG